MGKLGFRKFIALMVTMAAELSLVFGSYLDPESAAKYIALVGAAFFAGNALEWLAGIMKKG